MGEVGKGGGGKWRQLCLKNNFKKREKILPKKMPWLLIRKTECFLEISIYYSVWYVDFFKFKKLMVNISK